MKPVQDFSAADPAVRVWTENARPWVRAVRGCAVPGRQDGKDRAILSALAARKPRRVLDMGCGEGWLVRHAREALGCHAGGIDAAPPLIDAARRADPQGSYSVAEYARLCEGAWPSAAPERAFDAVVFNFALFSNPVSPILAVAATRLTKGGAILVQTISTETLPADRGEPVEGWRTETFEAFEGGPWAPMDWYCRSLDAWLLQAAAAGLTVSQTAIVRQDRPLSLLMVLQPQAAGQGQPLPGAR
jgi:cyclopropane fatty-acyl-phospholipid synthase-like methyltransferase